MTQRPSKYQLPDDRARVRELLMRDWDPIGVAGIPEAADEYDEYADRVYVMLREEQATAEAVAAYLFEIATRHMGLSNFPDLAERSARVAKALTAWR